MFRTVEHRQGVSTYWTKRTAGSATARRASSGKGFAMAVEEWEIQVTNELLAWISTLDERQGHK